MRMHLMTDAIPLVLCVARQQVSQLLTRLGDCLVVRLLGFLEHLLGLLNLHLAGRNIYACQDGVSRFCGFFEILQCLWPFCNSLGEHSALLGQLLLFITWRTATMSARYEAWCWKSGVLPWAWQCYPQERTEWVADETAALSYTQRPSTHLETWGRYSFWCAARVWYLAGVSWKKTLAELVGTQPLEWWLEDLQNAKISWSQQKNLLVPISHVRPIGWSGTKDFGLLLNAPLVVNRVWIQSVLSKEHSKH